MLGLSLNLSPLPNLNSLQRPRQHFNELRSKRKVVFEKDTDNASPTLYPQMASCKCGVGARGALQQELTLCLPHY